MESKRCAAKMLGPRAFGKPRFARRWTLVHDFLAKTVNLACPRFPAEPWEQRASMVGALSSGPTDPFVAESSTCTAAKPVCCVRGENREQLECSTEENCPVTEGASYSCTQPSDCLPGYFCGVSGYGGGCTLSFGDGMTQILCDTFMDCPRSFRERCKADGQSTVCAKGAPNLLPKEQGTCGCSD